MSPDSREGSEVRRSFQGKTKDEVPAIGVANDENACKVFGRDFFGMPDDRTKESDIVHGCQGGMVGCLRATVVPLSTERVRVGYEPTVLVGQVIKGAVRKAPETLAVTARPM